MRNLYLTVLMRKPAILILLLLFVLKAHGGINPKVATKKYPFKINNTSTFYSLEVTDDKFLQSGVVYRDAKNIVSLRVLDGVRITNSFTYTANLKITAYNAANADTTIYKSLTVQYDPSKGASYKGIASYDFSGRYKVKVDILSESYSGGQALVDSALELSNRIVVDRRDQAFTASAGIGPGYIKTQNATKKTVDLSWTPPTGAEEYDIEWTSANDGNPYYSLLKRLARDTSSANYKDTLAKVFKNNSTRITTYLNNYSIPIVGSDSIMLVRIRAVRYLADGLRETGDWDYLQNNVKKYAVFDIDWNESNLNWQYSATYAEDGKRKEVISYFDGTLRGRQTLTINTTDKVAVAQENVYDEFGRPAASILPAPIYEAPSALQYIKNLNKTTTRNYNYKDLTDSLGVNCEPMPKALSALTGGVSRYYSPQNQFPLTANNQYNKYIPDAEGYPFSVTRYTPDNTGRIRQQGGVGKAFQPGKGNAQDPSKTTKYYYGKPEQIELDSLFGNDVGTADHYSKNMVVDPNGQISISYLNASGKTIATALAGKAPAALDPLSSMLDSTKVKRDTVQLIRPEQFVFDAAALKITATTTYLATVKDAGRKLGFNVQQLVNKFPGTFSICSNCYYKMSITVTNDCKQVVSPVYVTDIGSKIANCTIDGQKSGNFSIAIDEPGEYQIKMELAFDNKVISTYADNMVTKGLDSGYVEKQFDFIKKRFLDSINAAGCYSDCHTCRTQLNDSTAFVANVRSTLIAMGIQTSGNNGTLNAWSSVLYTQLKAKCLASLNNCTYPSPCNATKALMLVDVSPGGQYALFKADGTPAEPLVNVITGTGLTPNYQLVFGEGYTQADYDASVVTFPDGTKHSPYDGDFTIQQIITYWKSAWAEKFLQFHPELCKLTACEATAQYRSWDQVLEFDVKDTQGIPSIVGNTAQVGWNSNAADNWLVNIDPFFSGSGPGAGVKSAMISDLQNYSTAVAKFPTNQGLPVKGLMAYMQYQLYCAETTGNTNNGYTTPSGSYINCVPVTACREPDREWTLYRSMYLALKQKYYDQISNCATGACQIGVTNTPTAIKPSCPTVNDIRLIAISDPASAGMQKIRVMYTRGPATAAFRVGVYYPATTANGTASNRNVQFVSGNTYVDIEVEQDIDVSTMLVSGVNCSGGNVAVLNPNLPDYYIEPGSYIQLNQFNDFIDPSYTVTRATLKHPNGTNYAALAPHGAFVEVRYTFSDNSSPIEVGIQIAPGDVYGEYRYKTTVGGSGGGGGPALRYSVAPDWGETNVVDPGGPGGPGTGGVTQSLSCWTLVGFATGVEGYNHCDDVIIPPAEEDMSCLIYAAKKSRFPRYDLSNFIPANATEQQAIDMQTKVEGEVAQMRTDVARYTAQAWINAFEQNMIGNNVTGTPYNNFVADSAALKAAFLSIVYDGFDTKHLGGASDLAGLPIGRPRTGSFLSFKAAIEGMPHNLMSLEINPWVLNGPPIYDTIKKVQNDLPVISATSASLCARLDALNTAAGGAANLYNYLVATYGNAMTLTQAEVTSLQRSCNNCRFILAKDITIPAFLDPNSTGVLSRAQFNSAKSYLSTTLGASFDTTAVNYYSVLTNYINRQYFLTIGVEDCYVFHHNSKAVLVNTPAFGPVKVDPYACLTSVLRTTAMQALNAYDEYIAEIKRQFREDYLNTCKLIKPTLDIMGKQQAYHYTLYYYDQADNLIRTVPPEGVHPLKGSILAQVKQVRDGIGANCTLDDSMADTSLLNALAALNGSMQTGVARAMETWTYNDGTQPTHFQAVDGSKRWLYQLTLKGAEAGVDIYPLTPGTNSVSMVANSKHYRASLPTGMVPLAPWTHVVVQSATGISGSNIPEFYINGVQLTLVAKSSPLGWFNVSSTTGSITYSTDVATLKHLRYYNRVMTVPEIVANAQSMCFMPQNTTAMTWFRFNKPTVAGPTTIANTTIETRYKETSPGHTLKTTYAYNSTNQVIKQNSPDGGTVRFWYDMLSRLVASQNDKQAIAGNFSYTLYEPVLGRITEVGEKSTTAKLDTATDNANTLPVYLNASKVSSFNGAGTNSQITATYYDVPATGTGIAALGSLQDNLRKRVAASTYRESTTAPVLNATYYDYDISGNVRTLWQQIDGLTNAADVNTLKRLDYEFDLVSGKVNLVRYQHNRPDRFYYKYEYDAENRITEAWSGTEIIEDRYTKKSKLIADHARRDAKYAYYLHGPLARVELGDNNRSVQGIDYAYTLQGWLKGVNGQRDGDDIGGDAQGTSLVAKDAFGYSLGYYTGDFKPINAGSTNAFRSNFITGTGDITGKNLYNGNISSATMRVDALGINTNGFTYAYDQLNRLKTVNRHEGLAAGNWDKNTITAKYKETFTYDANGNILTSTRQGDNGLMDNLTYNYNRDAATGYLKDNKLSSVNDAVLDNVYTTDLDNQAAGNYGYDAIGNLTKDQKNNFYNGQWTVYGKLKQFAKAANGTDLMVYSYDAAGNRVSKTTGGLATWYVRDAQGNTMAVYDSQNSTKNWREQHLYGSSRLGLWTPNVADISNPATTAAKDVWQTIGTKQYELSNHLGNVMATITDKRIQVSNPGGGSYHYEADVANAQEYYAFGSQMPGRTGYATFANNTYTWQTGPGNYRFGFNGKENDNDVGKGTGNQQDYGMRIYDSRVGRFLSMDPLAKDFPWFTPYQFAGNSPTLFIDLDGKEPKKKTLNYGKSVIIGLVYENSLEDKYLKENYKTVNTNWLGKSTDVNTGLEYIQSLSEGRNEKTELTTVIFNTHGGITLNTKIAGFLPDPLNTAESINTRDVQKFNANKDDQSLPESKKNALSSLQAIFGQIKDGGTFVFGACNLGMDPEFGKAMQQLSGGRINILLTPDKVRISNPTQKDYADEIALPKIQDHSIWKKDKENNYVRGFVLYPVKNGEPIELNKNIVIKSTGNETIKMVDGVK